jgi:hypothetical protein
MTVTQHVGILKHQFLHYVTIKMMLVIFHYQNNILVFAPLLFGSNLYRQQATTFLALAWVGIMLSFAVTLFIVSLYFGSDPVILPEYQRGDRTVGFMWQVAGHGRTPKVVEKHSSSSSFPATANGVPWCYVGVPHDGDNVVVHKVSWDKIKHIFEQVGKSAVKSGQRIKE